MLNQLHEDLVVMEGLSDATKGKVCMAISRADKCLVDGGAESLQLLDVTAECMRLINAR